jgi:hypothetical protein
VPVNWRSATWILLNPTNLPMDMNDTQAVTERAPVRLVVQTLQSVVGSAARRVLQLSELGMEAAGW